MTELLLTCLCIRDPRSRMLQQQQERKISGPKQPDGAKLSFQEKMKLFAQEVGVTVLIVKCLLDRQHQPAQRSQSADLAMSLLHSEILIIFSPER